MFKCFKYIDDMLKQLNEADETPIEDDAEMGGDEGMEGTEDPAAEGDTGAEGGEEMGGEEMPAEGGEEGGDPSQDPSQIADADAGTFVSDITNAEIAKTLLNAVLKANPNEIIPK
jgi:hypothetical protein